MQRGPAFPYEINDFSWFFPFYRCHMAAKPPILKRPDPPRVKPQVFSFSKKKIANSCFSPVLYSRKNTHSICLWWHGIEKKISIFKWKRKRLKKFHLNGSGSGSYEKFFYKIEAEAEAPSRSTASKTLIIKPT